MNICVRICALFNQTVPTAATRDKGFLQCNI